MGGKGLVGWDWLANPAAKVVIFQLEVFVEKLEKTGIFLWWIAVGMVVVWLLSVSVMEGCLCYVVLLYLKKCMWTYLMGIWHLCRTKTCVVSSSILVLVFLLSHNRNCTTHSCFKCKTLANISQCHEWNTATPVIHPGSGRYLTNPVKSLHQTLQ